MLRASAIEGCRAPDEMLELVVGQVLNRLHGAEVSAGDAAQSRWGRARYRPARVNTYWLSYLPGTDLTRYRTVVVWCRRFTTAFGAADLSPA